MTSRMPIRSIVVEGLRALFFIFYVSVLFGFVFLARVYPDLKTQRMQAAKWQQFQMQPRVLRPPHPAVFRPAPVVTVMESSPSLEGPRPVAQQAEKILKEIET